MLPEIALVEVEPARVRRLLRKLLDRIADLEEDAAPLPSSLDNCLGAARKHLGGSRKYVADHQQRLAGCRGSGAKAPPAHPFEHLLKKRLPRPPRYTYKRRKCNASASSSDIVDGTKPLQRSAMLPLKIKAAFGLGEAIALSDGSDDLDYLDEMYCSLPPLLVRFVLWQHAVSLCHLRIPQYVDTLFESL
ncbi:hypothetical protein LPJ63_004335, partial [Coemansia sp. RSA 2711]